MKAFSRILALAMVFTLLACSAALADVPSQQLTIGTASSGGAFYTIGTGLAEVITQNVEPLNVTAEITGGSTENIRLVGEEESDMGISNADVVAYALEGAEPYNKVYDLKAICALHSSVLHIVTLEGTGVETVQDLKGKRVAVGPAGGGSINGIDFVLRAAGMSIDDISCSYLSYDDGITQLKDGQVDAALVMAGYPASSILSLGATDTVKLVSIDDELMAKVIELAPYFYSATVPASVYGTEDDVTVVGVKNILHCTDYLSEDTVYAITKALVENMDTLVTYHNALSKLTPADLVGTGNAPLHAGAEKYYREAGLIK